MKKQISISVESEKLSALNMYLEQKNMQVQEKAQRREKRRTKSAQEEEIAT